MEASKISTGQLESFLGRLGQAIAQGRRSGLKDAVLLHHDESDGLTSAALAKLALEHLGLTTQLVCLDKLYPEVVAGLENGPPRVIAYADLGSGHIDWLKSQNKTGNLIIVLDHHVTVPSTDPFVHNLNPELDGFSGEKDASSSTIAYLFAKTVDSALSKMAHLGIIGAVEVPGDVSGLNKEVVEEAVELGLAKPSRNDYTITVEGMNFSRTRAASMLNMLGSVGYYRDGPRAGIEACLHGFTPETRATVRGLEMERKEANRKMIQKLRRKGMEKAKLIQWFHARDNYKGMGGKVVGSFCSYLRYQGWIDHSKYLVGMMNVPPDIPGWGSLSSSLVKVSGRAPQGLAEMIEAGKKPPLSRILPEACSRLGGFGDGHSVAASGVFPVGREAEFVEVLDRLAGEALC